MMSMNTTQEMGRTQFVLPQVCIIHVQLHPAKKYDPSVTPKVSDAVCVDAAHDICLRDVGLMLVEKLQATPLTLYSKNTNNGAVHMYVARELCCADVQEQRVGDGVEEESCGLIPLDSALILDDVVAKLAVATEAAPLTLYYDQERTFGCFPCALCACFVACCAAMCCCCGSGADVSANSSRRRLRPNNNIQQQNNNNRNSNHYGYGGGGNYNNGKYSNNQITNANNSDSQIYYNNPLTTNGNPGL